MILDAYISLFRSYAKDFNAQAPEWLVQAREASLQYLLRHQDLSEADAYATDFGLNPKRIRPQGDPSQLFTCEIPGITSYNFLVLNDSCFAQPKQQLPEGVVVCALSDAFVRYPELVARYWGKAKTENANWHFNQLFAQDGLFVYLPKGVTLDRPIQLVNLMYDNQPRMAVSHNLIIVEDDAQAQVLVCDHAYGESPCLSNRYTEVFVGRNARYEHYKLESTHREMTNVSALTLCLQDGAEVLTNNITLHGGRTANDVRAALMGEGARLSVNGLALGDHDQSIRNHTCITHQVAGSVSTELFKYLLDGQSQGEFFGLVKVEEGADRTTALQTNRNLCLSADARMQSQPQLEIYADDVQCNHGSATGQLDENALFYMQTRGISEKEARFLLMSAFAYEVLDNVGISAVKDRLRWMIERRLRGEKYNCATCSMCK